MGEGGQFVDLGAGDCCKAMGWLPFVSPRRYIAVDIAEAGDPAGAHRAWRRTFPTSRWSASSPTSRASLDLEGVLDNGPTTFFYPGSSIGNFTPERGAGFPRARFAAIAPSGREAAC